MKYTILHADDDTLFSRIVKQILQQNGFDVHSVYDGEEAWSLFNQLNFDSCLLDIMMPGLNGIDLGERIRRVNKEIIIVYLSGEDPAMIAGEAFGRGGGNGYFVKTFNLRKLSDILHLYLRISHYHNN